MALFDFGRLLAREVQTVLAEINAVHRRRFLLVVGRTRRAFDRASAQVPREAHWEDAATPLRAILDWNSRV